MKGLTLVVMAALALTACASAQPGASGTATTAAVPTPTARGDCAMTTEPGPADEPNRGGGDLIDMSDYGGGRWRLCLTEPALASVEHTAWCIWKRDRTAVSEIAGLGATIGELDYDASISIDRNAFDFGTVHRGSGIVASYRTSQVPRGESGPANRAGYVAFEVVLIDDQEGGTPSPGVALRYAGLMRWQCTDPPPPR